MPAVAIVDDYYEEDDDYEKKNNVVSADNMNITMTSSSSDNSNTPRFMGSNNRISGNGGGGNTPGGGKHRCPKCGAFVTFQENNTNRIQNCFYCAACSGWFLVQPDHEVRGEHNRMLLERLGRGGNNGSGKLEGVQVKRGENQFVMQDVSRGM